MRGGPVAPQPDALVSEANSHFRRSRRRAAAPCRPRRASGECEIRSLGATTTSQGLVVAGSARFGARTCISRDRPSNVGREYHALPRSQSWDRRRCGYAERSCPSSDERSHRTSCHPLGRAGTHTGEATRQGAGDGGERQHSHDQRLWPEQRRSHPKGKCRCRGVFEFQGATRPKPRGCDRCGTKEADRPITESSELSPRPGSMPSAARLRGTRRRRLWAKNQRIPPRFRVLNRRCSRTRSASLP